MLVQLSPWKTFSLPSSNRKARKSSGTPAKGKTNESTCIVASVTATMNNHDAESDNKDSVVNDSNPSKRRRLTTNHKGKKRQPLGITFTSSNAVSLLEDVSSSSSSLTTRSSSAPQEVSMKQKWTISSTPGPSGSFFPTSKDASKSTKKKKKSSTNGKLANGDHNGHNGDLIKNVLPNLPSLYDSKNNRLYSLSKNNSIIRVSNKQSDDSKEDIEIELGSMNLISLSFCAPKNVLSQDGDNEVYVVGCSQKNDIILVGNNGKCHSIFSPSSHSSDYESDMAHHLWTHTFPIQNSSSILVCNMWLNQLGSELHMQNMVLKKDPSHDTSENANQFSLQREWTSRTPLKALVRSNFNHQVGEGDKCVCIDPTAAFIRPVTENSVCLFYKILSSAPTPWYCSHWKLNSDELLREEIDSDLSSFIHPTSLGFMLRSKPKFVSSLSEHIVAIVYDEAESMSLHLYDVHNGAILNSLMGSEMPYVANDIIGMTSEPSLHLLILYREDSVALSFLNSVNKSKMTSFTPAELLTSSIRNSYNHSDFFDNAKSLTTENISDDLSQFSSSVFTQEELSKYRVALMKLRTCGDPLSFEREFQSIWDSIHKDEKSSLSKLNGNRKRAPAQCRPSPPSSENTIIPTIFIEEICQMSISHLKLAKKKGSTKLRRAMKPDDPILKVLTTIYISYPHKTNESVMNIISSLQTGGITSLPLILKYFLVCGPQGGGAPFALSEQNKVDLWRDILFHLSIEEVVQFYSFLISDNTMENKHNLDVTEIQEYLEEYNKLKSRSKNGCSDNELVDVILKLLHRCQTDFSKVIILHSSTCNDGLLRNALMRDVVINRKEIGSMISMLTSLLSLCRDSSSITFELSSSHSNAIPKRRLIQWIQATLDAYGNVIVDESQINGNQDTVEDGVIEIAMSLLNKAIQHEKCVMSEFTGLHSSLQVMTNECAKVSAIDDHDPETNVPTGYSVDQIIF